MLLLAASALATPTRIDLPTGMCGYESSWVHNGSSHFDGCTISLNDAGGTIGTAWWVDRAEWGPTHRLRLRYQLEITDFDNVNTREGLAFVMHDWAGVGTAAVGSNLGPGFIGMQDYVAIEVDTRDNGVNDPDPTHFAVIVDGTAQETSGQLAAVVNDGVYSVWIDIDQASGAIAVYHTLGSNALKPTDPTLTTTYDLAAKFPDGFWFGFTGSNGPADGSNDGDHEIPGMVLHIDADADGDGRLAFEDACDTDPIDADADGDGVPDGCDVCPAGDDGVDTDADGVPDA